VLAVIDSQPPCYQLLGRVHENSIRLASLHAISCGGPDAAVAEADLEYGAAWALDSALKMIDGAGSMMARNDHERMVNDVKGIIRNEKGISQNELSRRTQHIKSSDLTSIINRIESEGDILVDKGKAAVGRGRPKTTYRWVGD
jgi:hypothetical protein